LVPEPVVASEGSAACGLPGTLPVAAPADLRYPLVLWDGECGFCAKCVDWARSRGAGEAFMFLPYQVVPSPPMTPELTAACARAVHVLEEDGRTLRAGRACLAVLERCGWGRAARVLAWPPFVWAVELGYWLVARNRRFFSRWLA
jgi:predicted DCC family thiol-disulfide oxidoreductase YuxK